MQCVCVCACANMRTPQEGVSTHDPARQCIQPSGRISRSDNKGAAKWFLGGVGSQLSAVRRNRERFLTVESLPGGPACCS